MRIWIALQTWWRRHWIILTRYPFNTAASLASGYLLFLLVFAGYRVLGESSGSFGAGVDGLVVGFMVFAFVVTSYQELSYVLTEEAVLGTLEQVAMSPLGLLQVLMIRMAAFLGVGAAMAGTLLVLMMLTTGTRLHLDLASLIPLLLLTVMSGLGIGFVMGGLALVFKRVEAAFQLGYWLFVALVLTPVSEVPELRFLPVAWGTELIRRVMIDGSSLAQLPAGHLALLLVNAIAWLGLGTSTFWYFDRLARRWGVMGHY